MTDIPITNTSAVSSLDESGPGGVLCVTRLGAQSSSINISVPVPLLNQKAARFLVFLNIEHYRHNRNED